ncbi:MAG: ComEA family DNA-binding protein [Solirubrobacterales bacterium]|nr:ComEA family DNA-binding protein [Solirubrobacterales bacterium]
MAGISRNQIIVYALIAAVLLLVGANSLRSGSNGSGGSLPASLKTKADPADSKDGSGTEGTGFSATSGAELLVVDVSGGVVRPGVYELKQGTRVIDAIKRAGGLVKKAVPGAINRAAVLADGQQVVVPVAAAAGGASTASSPAGVAGSPDAPVSLGAATPEQLEEIEGIGPVTAAKIIEFRDSKGVGSIDDLDQVSGIGPVTMEALRSGLQP